VSATAVQQTERISRFYTPFPRQKLFHASPAKYRLFGGAAGPGKTKALLWEAITQANETPKSDTLLLRRTFPELETSLIKEFRNGVPRDLYHDFNESKHVITWHNGSTTRFGYCKRENDVYQYQGAEFLFIGLDELTHFTLKQWQYLTSRNRCPIPGSYPSMAGATNPGNIGHVWVKALWIEGKAPLGFDHPELYDKAEYEFIPARLDDNPIYANDTIYRRTLETLPEALRKALLEGDWNIFAGQYFDIFTEADHVTPFQELNLEPWWPRWVSIDWGFEHEAAVYWHAETETRNTITYREFVKNKLSPRDLALAIVEKTANDTIAQVYLSPDAFAHRTAESSVAEQMSEVFRANGMPSASPAADDRIGGWTLLYQLFQTKMATISSACSRLVDCIPTLTRDPEYLEDVLKMDGDDPADAYRYGLYSRLRSVTAPMEVRMQRKVEAAKFTDPTSEMIFRSKWEKQEQRKAKPVHFGRRWRQ
jgi:phage terminase large subunit